jgi:hypothetical protein
MGNKELTHLEYLKQSLSRWEYKKARRMNEYDQKRKFYEGTISVMDEFITEIEKEILQLESGGK